MAMPSSLFNLEASKPNKRSSTVTPLGVPPPPRLVPDAALRRSNDDDDDDDDAGPWRRYCMTCFVMKKPKPKVNASQPVAIHDSCYSRMNSTHRANTLEEAISYCKTSRGMAAATSNNGGK